MALNGFKSSSTLLGHSPLGSILLIHLLAFSSCTPCVCCHLPLSFLRQGLRPPRLDLGDNVAAPPTLAQRRASLDGHAST